MLRFFVVYCGTALLAQAQTLTTLANFNDNGPGGYTPGHAALLQGADGSFYGVTILGGGCSTAGCGTIFSVNVDGVLTTLHNFQGPDGSQPIGGLIQAANGLFYGTAHLGGASNMGTVFAMAPSGAFAVLHSFNGTDGSQPYGTLFQARDGNLYGTTQQGGTTGCGTVFRMTPAGVLKTLHNFANTDGCAPEAALIQAGDGYLYGTTNGGGPVGYGTAFRMSEAGELTTIYYVDGLTNAQPSKLIQASDGNFYGTASGGDGVVFQLTPGGELTDIYGFTFLNQGGYVPHGGVVQGPNGMFYGTTYIGGANVAGTVYSVTSAGIETTLFSFDGTNGGTPEAGLLLGAGGVLYGTTNSGGTGGGGTVFALTLGPS